MVSESRVSWCNSSNVIACMGQMHACSHYCLSLTLSADFVHCLDFFFPKYSYTWGFGPRALGNCIFQFINLMNYLTFWCPGSEPRMSLAPGVPHFRLCVPRGWSGEEPFLAGSRAFPNLGLPWCLKFMSSVPMPSLLPTRTVAHTTTFPWCLNVSGKQQIWACST